MNPSDISADKIELFTREQLEQFPDFEKYDAFVKAIQNDRLVVFYGAGVSMLGGSASWVELAQSIVNKLPSVFSHLERIVLSEMALGKARDVITICHERVKGNRVNEELYYSAIRDAVKPKDDKIAGWKEAYSLLLELNPVAFITTNIDKAIEIVHSAKLGDRRVINLSGMLEEKYLNISSESENPAPNCAPEHDRISIGDIRHHVCKGNVFYLHGSIKQIDRAILGIDQYIDHYYRSEYIAQFLRYLFSGKYTVLFIGYSLEEYEILQNIYLAANSEERPAGGLQHFILTPLHTKDIAKFNIQRHYFKMFSVCPMPYFVDYAGHDKILEILSRLVKLQRKNQAPLEMVNLIDSV